MKYKTVSSLCEGIAESIRRKEGSTEKINPQDFVQRIDNLQVGGGTSESNIEYLDVSGFWDKVQVVIFSTLIKVNGIIVPTGALAEFALQGNDAFASAVVSLNQVAIDGALEINLGDGNVPIRNAIEGYDSIPRITKEQFYSLE